jgi:hypothetical protein
LIREVHPHTVAIAGLDTLTFKGVEKNALGNHCRVVFKIVSL